MKISLDCKDLILEKTLELFLKDHLVLKKDCDFLVCDSKSSLLKPQFIIASSAHLQVPFSKEELLKALYEFECTLKEFANKLLKDEKKALEKKIEELSLNFEQEYQDEIKKASLALKTKLLKTLDEF